MTRTYSAWLILGCMTLSACGDDPELASGQPFAAEALSDFRFTVVAATGADFAGLGVPSINNTGIIAFGGSRPRPDRKMGIYVSRGTSVAPVTEAIAGFNINAIPSINDRGVIAFSALFRADRSFAFYVARRGTLRKIAENTLDSEGPGGINNEGVVVFRRETISTANDIITYKDSLHVYRDPSETLVDETPGGSSIGRPSINTAGTIAYVASPSRRQVSTLRLVNGRRSRSLADTRGRFSGLFDPSINDAGAVAFVARLDAGGTGLYVVQDGQPRTLVEASGPIEISAGISVPTLNNKNQVAFRAYHDDRTGIYTGADPVSDKVIETGDRLAGSLIQSTFDSLVFGDLNDAGQIVFQAQLVDGRQVIVRADPGTRTRN